MWRKDVLMANAVSAFPTFKFFVSGKQVDELKGADQRTLENKIKQHIPEGMTGPGNKLGWDGVGQPPGPPVDPREARMKAFGAMGSGSSSTKPPPVAPTAGTSEDEEIAKAIALSLEETKKTDDGKGSSASSASSTAAEEEKAANEKDYAEAVAAIEKEQSEDWDGEEMVPLPVDKDLLQQLMDMGFPDVRCRKAIHHGVHLDGAIAWLTEHQDDPDIDQPYMVRKRDTIPKVPLTEEEKAAKVAEMQAKVKALREKKAKAAKEDEIVREKERRERGKKSTEIDELREKTARKLEAQRAKKEKEDSRKERERLRAEIAADKAARLANKGVLPSVLGVDGYNPSAVQYDQGVGLGGAPPGTAPAASSTSAPAKKASTSAAVPPVENPSRAVEQALTTISRYRTGGDGGAALKLICTFLKNIVENPNETKYRSINSEGKAFTSKFNGIVGPIMLLRAVGFVKEEEKFVLGESCDMEFVKNVYEKVVQAEAKYREMNP